MVLMWLFIELIQDEIQRILAIVVDAAMYSVVVDESTYNVGFWDDHVIRQSSIIMMYPVVPCVLHRASLWDVINPQ